MRAIVTRPGAGRAWLADIPEPSIADPQQVVVRMLRVNKWASVGGLAGLKEQRIALVRDCCGVEAEHRLQHEAPFTEAVLGGDHGVRG